MTWGEFKQAVEQHGAQDSDVLIYIDIREEDPDVAALEVSRDREWHHPVPPPGEPFYLRVC